MQNTSPQVKPWAGRARQNALAQVKRAGRRNKTPCIICHMTINYSLEYPHPQSCSVQHIKPRKTFPHLTWDPANWAPAHLDCNKSAGTRGEEQSLGILGDW